jgi:hypothetical protein
MQLVRSGPRVSQTTALVSVVAIVMLSVMAFAMPPSRIDVEDATTRRGVLFRHSGFSAVSAEQLARDGYNLMVIDLTTASLGEDALWRRHLDAVAKRQFQVWAWVDDSRIAKDDLEKIAAAANVTGLCVYGPKAESTTAWIRTRFSRLEHVVPVTRALAPADFVAAPEAGVKVLRAAGLSRGDVEKARAGVKGDYIVAPVALD